MIRRWKPGVPGTAGVRYVRLMPYEGRSIRLVAVDPIGKGVFCGNILFFRPDGRINRAPDVNPALGFQLTSGGEICISSQIGDDRPLDDFAPPYNPWIFFGGPVRWDKVKLTLQNSGDGVALMLVTGNQTFFGVTLSPSGTVNVCGEGVLTSCSNPLFRRLLPCNINRGLLVL